jgi:ketol-acid reductoisomerase
MQPAPMKIYYDKDADLALIQGKKVVIIGYGSQGHAHANNLKDSGVKVVVALRPGSASASKAEKAGLTVQPIEQAVADADLVMLLAPDEHQAALYRQIEPKLRKGAALAFAHGFNIHYRQIEPRTDLDVIMVAPKGPGHLVRSHLHRGRRRALPDRRPPGRHGSGTRIWRSPTPMRSAADGPASSRPPSAKRPRPTCSASRLCCAAALTHWSRRASRRWSRPAMQPEMAYFECLHELKLIVDLMYEGGIANMRYSISTPPSTATSPAARASSPTRPSRDEARSSPRSRPASSPASSSDSGQPPGQQRAQLSADHEGRGRNASAFVVSARNPGRCKTSPRLV